MEFCHGTLTFKFLKIFIVHSKCLIIMHHCISRIKWQYLGTLVASVGIFFQINWRKSGESINPLPIEMGTFDFWLWCKLITPVEMVTERGSSLESSKDFKSIYSLFKFFFFLDTEYQMECLLPFLQNLWMTLLAHLKTLDPKWPKSRTYWHQVDLLEVVATVLTE